MEPENGETKSTRTANSPGGGFLPSVDGEPTVQILRRGHVTGIGVTLAGHGAPFVWDVVILDALAPYLLDFSRPATVHASGSVAPGGGEAGK